MLATFYILFSPSADKHYIGHTTEAVDIKLRKHLSDHCGFTGKFKDGKLIYIWNHTIRKNLLIKESVK